MEPPPLDRLADWLGHVVILPVDLRVSYVWGRLAGAAQQRGRPRPVNDMWIAAVALSNDIPVATRNVKDYSDFVEHHGLDLVNPRRLRWSGRRRPTVGR